MKKLLMVFTIILCKAVIVFAQDINSSSPVVLPVAGNNVYTVNSGQTINISSAQSITLNPGVTIEAGATVTVATSAAPIYPLPPSNPSDDDDKNWILTTSYALDGSETGTTKRFFDNNGNLTQTQSKNESTGYMLCTQTLYDFFGRTALKTLPAPLNNSAFAYAPNFISNNGQPYTYNNFDGDPSSTNSQYEYLNNAQPIDNGQIGTLGWYYSNNNSWDKFVPATSYPYSRTDFTQDGTAMSNRVSAVGEKLQMGGGHEKTQSSFPVINELNNYANVRAALFPASIMGVNSKLNTGSAVQTISTDNNGLQSITVTDLSGKILMTGTADPNGYLSVANTVTLSAAVAPAYQFDVNNYRGDPNFQGINDITNITVSGEYPITIFCNSCGQNYGYQVLPSDLGTLPVASGQALLISCSAPFYVTGTNSGNVTEYDNAEAQLAQPSGSTVQYFRLTNASPVTVSAGFSDTYELYDVVNGTDVTSALQAGSTLPPGFYKLSSIIGANGDSGPVTITYTNSFTNIDYNFYDQMGQLIAHVSPNGVKQLQGDLSGYTDYTAIPFTTTYNYNQLGRMVSSTSPDAGTTNYIYCSDGKIRFSQNAYQQTQASVASITSNNVNYVEKFSYINYDPLGRVIETGEYAVTAHDFTNLNTNTLLIANTDPSGGLSLIDPSGVKVNTVNYYYDSPDPRLAKIATSGYLQDPGFLKGNLSYTQNANNTTWYNYDQLGRPTWIIKYSANLGTKTIDYTYNAQGLVSVVDYQKGNPADRFIHYYSYDQDRNLITVQTSVDGNTIVPQAHYYYYLHGPLKRVEIAGDLQGIDYVYTPQGWLKSINSSTGVPANDPSKDGMNGLFAKDVFGLQLEYFNGDYYRVGSNMTSITSVDNGSMVKGQPANQGYYNGTVSGISWQTQQSTGAVPSTKMYAYNYDSNYQLTNSVWGAPDFTNQNFTSSTNFNEAISGYDLNGNILGLSRTDNYGTTDDRFGSYNYNKGNNQLTSVGKYGLYTYNAIGQLQGATTIPPPNSGNGAKQMYFPQYDANGHMTAVYADPLQTTILLSYAYDEDGNRISRTDFTSVTPVITNYAYDANHNIVSIYNGSNLLEVPVYGSDRLGSYFAANANYEYELKDNVGSVRAVINRNKINGNADVVSYTDYYPFGKIAQSSTNGSTYRYDYQGEYAQKDNVTGWNNFNFRTYDSDIGRWLTTDPSGQFESPYESMGNDPVTQSDPDGRYSYLGAVAHWVLYNAVGYDPGHIFQRDPDNPNSWGFVRDFDSEPRRFDGGPAWAQRPPPAPIFERIANNLVGASGTSKVTLFAPPPIKSGQGDEFSIALYRVKKLYEAKKYVNVNVTSTIGHHTETEVDYSLNLGKTQVKINPTTTGVETEFELSESSSGSIGRDDKGLKITLIGGDYEVDITLKPGGETFQQAVVLAVAPEVELAEVDQAIEQLTGKYNGLKQALLNPEVQKVLEQELALSR